MYKEILEESVTIHQDSVHKMEVDLPAEQRNKTNCKEDSQLVPEEEYKVVGMAQSITSLKPNRTFVGEAEAQD